MPKMKEAMQVYRERKKWKYGVRSRYVVKPELVDSLMKAAVTSLPSYTYHDLADVIHECLLHDRVGSSINRALMTL